MTTPTSTALLTAHVGWYRKRASATRRAITSLRSAGGAVPGELEALERELALWEQLANEIDGYLASDQPGPESLLF